MPAARGFSSQSREFWGWAVGGAQPGQGGYGQVSEPLFYQLDHLTHLVFVFWAFGTELERIYSRQETDAWRQVR